MHRGVESKEMNKLSIIKSCFSLLTDVEARSIFKAIQFSSDPEVMKLRDKIDRAVEVLSSFPDDSASQETNGVESD